MLYGGVCEGILNAAIKVDCSSVGDFIEVAKDYVRNLDSGIVLKLLVDLIEFDDEGNIEDVSELRALLKKDKDKALTVYMSVEQGDFNDDSGTVYMELKRSEVLGNILCDKLDELYDAWIGERIEEGGFDMVLYIDNIVVLY